MVPGKPLTERQRKRIARAVHDAEEWTGLEFCVYLGPVQGDARTHAESLMAGLGLTEQPAVLLFVAPEARRFEILTSAAATRRVPEYATRLAALAMTASFEVGDIAGGVGEGARLLAQAAGRGTRIGPELPDVVG